MVLVLQFSARISIAQDQPAQPPKAADPHAGHHMPEQKNEDTAVQPPHDHSQMQGHDQMAGMNHDAGMNEAGMFLMNMASGTSMNPLSWRMPMLMPRLGSWSLMLMGQAFLVDTQQSGTPRRR